MPSGYLPRFLLVVLPLTIAFCIIGASVGLNALIKSNRDKAHFKKIVPPPVTHVSIDTRDITDAGVVLTVGCALLALSANAALEAVSPMFTKGVSAKAKRMVSWAVVVCTVWILVCEIAFTVLFATRGPKVRAWVGSMELPQSAVQESEKELGATTLYKDFFYLRLLCILPWVAFALGGISALALFASGNPEPGSPAAPLRSPGGSVSTRTGEKSVQSA